MDKSELLRALQTEIQKDNLSTFMHEEQEGRPNRLFPSAQAFGTVGQFKFHVTDDVLPPLLDSLASDKSET
jgi:hypothetical protein